MINVLIADDHQLMIDGITSALADAPEIEVVASVKNGVEVLNILDKREIDVILMDINMPELDGLECTKKVQIKYPGIKVIALTQYGEKRFIKKMIKYGAKGYMLKDSTRQELIEGISKVYSGDSYFSDRLTINFLDTNRNLRNSNILLPKLTGREKEILNLICKGNSSQEIGDILSISFHTVESHRSNLFIKSSSKNVAGLVRWAFENELVD